MNCREVQRQLAAAPEIEIPASTQTALASHLAGCAACRRVNEALVGGLAAWRARTVDGHVPDAENAWIELRRVIRNSSSAPRRPALAWLAIPVAAAAAAVAAFYVAPTSRRTAAPPAAALVASHLPAGPAGNSADSTVVFVDDKSGWTFVLSSDTGARRS
ncbi:MAG TPA: hypothetical protein VHE61_02745 [Opitutaceae bacterium]|nr:hypothetical protein [Opitutaceae bacterium]